MSEARPAALIFRKRVLPWSETFIGAQAGALTRYRPVLAGYHRDLGGAAYVHGMSQFLLDEQSRFPALEKLLLKEFGRVPPRWKRGLARQRPVVLHAHFGSSAVPGRHLARALAIPLLLTYHGMDITVRAHTSAEMRRRHQAFASADRVIAVSEYIAEMVRSAGCPAHKVVVHYIGVDTRRFSPGSESPSPTRVLFVGRLVAKKGAIHLIRAMREVCRAIPAAELVIAGDGNLRVVLEQEAAALDVPARFLGVQTPEQVRDLMRSAAVLAGPSIADARGNTEGLPMAFIEAQACGLPVVVAMSGGAAEGVVDGETGLLFEPGDEAALARHLVTLLSDAALRARVRQAARAHVEQRFDLVRQTAKLETIYDEVRERH
jgi:glycosyltransferase involved in cell wall biosynthesis